jgi:restriction system protein
MIMEGQHPGSGKLAIPDYQELMLPVLRVACRGETRVPVAADEIANLLNLSAEERNEFLPSGKQRLLHNRIHWAKFYMSKAGLIESPARGLFLATAAGRKLLADNPHALNVHFLKTIPAFAAFYDRNVQTEVDDMLEFRDTVSENIATPEEQIDGAQTLLHAALRSELLQRILDNPPAFFERVIVDLLVGMGYGGSHDKAAQRLGKTGDGGIDGIIDEDRLGLDRIYVQAKRYAPGNSVQRPEIQGFVGSLVGLGATKGVFVTTSNFSSGANEFVRHLPQRVILINGARLSELMVEHGVGVRTTRTIAIKRLDEDFFDEAI